VTTPIALVDCNDFYAGVPTWILGSDHIVANGIANQPGRRVKMKFVVRTSAKVSVLVSF
jgi:hypothetical protein